MAPPHCPNLNPLDFSVWAVMEAKINKQSYHTETELRAAVQQAWDELDLPYLRATIEAVPHRLRSCIRAGGGIFE